MSGGVLKTGLTLAVIGAICTALVASTYHFTRDRIAANDKALLEQSLAPALSRVVYDSGLTDSRLALPPVAVEERREPELRGVGGQIGDEVIDLVVLGPVGTPDTLARNIVETKALRPRHERMQQRTGLTDVFAYIEVLHICGHDGSGHGLYWSDAQDASETFATL